MRVMASTGRSMVMATKRAIARKRALVSTDDIKITLAETRTTTTTTIATQWRMMMLMMMTKTMVKTTKMTVRRRRWGSSVHISISKLDSGCCWLLVRGRGGRQEARKVDIQRN